MALLAVMVSKTVKWSRENTAKLFKQLQPGFDGFDSNAPEKTLAQYLLLKRDAVLYQKFRQVFVLNVCVNRVREFQACGISNGIAGLEFFGVGNVS